MGSSHPWESVLALASDWITSRNLLEQGVVAVPSEVSYLLSEKRRASRPRGVHTSS